MRIKSLLAAVAKATAAFSPSHCSGTQARSLDLSPNALIQDAVRQAPDILLCGFFSWRILFGASLSQQLPADWEPAWSWYDLATIEF
jgi:hypothetical protein